VTTQPTTATGRIFYWIGLKVVNPEGDSIFLRGPFNTPEGRDRDSLRHSGFWQSTKTEFKPFETQGKVRAEANQIARAVLDAPDTPKELAQLNQVAQLRTSVPQAVPQAVSQVPPQQATPQPAETGESSGGLTAGTPSMIDVIGETPGLVEIASLTQKEIIGDSMGPEDITPHGMEEIMGEDNGTAGTVLEATTSLVDAATSARTDAFSEVEDELQQQFQEQTGTEEEHEEAGRI
jgi:hypothetical protein